MRAIAYGPADCAADRPPGPQDIRGVDRRCSWFPPPALAKSCHCSLAGGCVAVRRRTILMMPKGERPHPWRSHWRGVHQHDAADDTAVGEHVVIIFAPFAGHSARRCALEHQRCHAGTSGPYLGHLNPHAPILSNPSSSGLILLTVVAISPSFENAVLKAAISTVQPISFAMFTSGMKSRSPDAITSTA